MLKILICKLCGLILTNVIEIKNTKMNIEIIYFVYILNVTLVELFYIFVVLITLIYIWNIKVNGRKIRLIVVDIVQVIIRQW